MADRTAAAGCGCVFLLAVLGGTIGLAVEAVTRYWMYILPALILGTAPWWTLPIRKRRYFNSAEFQERKAAVAGLVAEHNEIALYIAELRSRGAFDLDAASTGRYAHLATSHNTSRHNYRRDRNVAHLSDPHVHNCSLSIVQRARQEPLRYLMKYFGVTADEQSLARVEAMNASVASLSQAIDNLHAREALLATKIAPPAFIERHYMKEFMEQTGVALSPIEVPCPVYRFEYVSPGGNSSQSTQIALDAATLDALVCEVADKIKWRKSVAGQRSLMTSRLRDAIKKRDRYTCQQCGVSVAQEPHLLIEVDHIIPVSRGGLTTPSNLQALCWRCNRTKSNKVA